MPGEIKSSSDCNPCHRPHWKDEAYCHHEDVEMFELLGTLHMPYLVWEDSVEEESNYMTDPPEQDLQNEVVKG